MLRPQKPLSYLISSGETTSASTQVSDDFQKILQLIKAAVAASVDLIQVREKGLPVSVLFELVTRASHLTRGSVTKLLVNDRVDVAIAAGADGVQLTGSSISASVVRQTFGSDAVIGVSTHSLPEARAAKAMGADFAVFGPVFETPAKTQYGPPLGVERLKEVCSDLKPFPVIAIGGIDEQNFAECLRAGAAGVAAIRMFQDTRSLQTIVENIHQY